MTVILSGGEQSRTVVIRDSRIASSVTRDHFTGRMTIQHQRASRSTVDTTRDVLVYAVYVPTHAGVVVKECSPPQLQPYVTLRPAGSYGGRCLMHVEVDVIGFNSAIRSTLLDEFVVSLGLPSSMTIGPALQPPVGPIVVNSQWASTAAEPTAKSVESSQNAVDPQLWYHTARQFVRIETAHDGVAVIRATDVLALGTFGALDSLALFWRGVQQPIYVDDADRSSTFTDGDQIYFLGRRAAGDTSYLDEQDSVSVFYLTGSLVTGPRLRLTRDTTNDPVPDSVIGWLDMEARYERDTGYYHPGNGVDDDHGKLFTPRAFLEGFYWATLNARIQQAGRFPIPFIPAAGSKVTVSADLATTISLAAFNPDHGFDVLFPGSESSVRAEVDGFGRHRIVDTLIEQDVPPVGAELIVQATGFPDRVDSAKWASLVLVDGIEVKGKGASIAQQGKLHGRLSLTTAVQLFVENLPDKSMVIIDSTTRQIRFIASELRTHHVRAAAVPYRDPKRPFIAQAGRYTVNIAVGDEHVTDDSVTAYALGRVAGSPPRLNLQRFPDARSVVQFLNGTSAQQPLVVVCVSGAQDAELAAALRSRGVSIPDTATPRGWIASSAAGQGRFTTISGHVDSYRADSGRSYRSNVVVPPGQHDLFLGSGQGIESARAMAATNDFVSKHDWSQGADVIAIVYRAHMDEARRWAQHREAFSNVRIAMFDVESIFEAYACGRHSPHAIKAFLADAWKRSKDRKPTHCVLIGNASWDVRVAVRGSNVDARRQDQIPTYGNPVSDFWYGLLDDEKDLTTPELIVSRLPALTSGELRVLVDKIITADTVSFAPYQRRVLYAGGGKPEESFCSIFYRLLRDEFGSGVDFSAAPLCLDTVVVCKENVDQPGRKIRSLINEGVGLVNFFGHGGTELFDIEDWRPWQLANEGRYPVLATFSCLTGGFASPSTTCENSKYLFEPRYGASAAIGSTGLQYVATADFLLLRIHEVLARTKIRAIGAMMYEAKRSMALLNTTFGNNATHQFSLLGDPFTRIRIDTAVEVSLPAQSVRLSTRRSADPIVETDSTVWIDLEVWSQGLGTTQPVEVRLRRTYGAFTDSSSVVLSDGVCRTAGVRFELAIADMPGRHDIVMIVDPDRKLGDRPDNNVVRISLDVAKPSLIILEPEAGRVVHPDSLIVRVIDVLSTQSTSVDVRMALCRRRDTSTAIRRSRAEELRRVPGTALVDWLLPSDVRRDTNGTYWIGAWPAVSSSEGPISIQWQPVSMTYGPADATSHRLVADQIASVAPDGSFDSLTHRIYLPAVVVPLSVRSAGKPTADPVRDPSMSFRLRDSVLLENSFRVGLNILVFSVYDSLPRMIRRYDTSPSGSPIEAGHNGYAQECITFLRDSVASEDIVALAACDESFTRFQRDGLIDQLRELLREYGAKQADSITAASSYALIGSRGYRRLTPVEQLSRSGQVVVAGGVVPFTWDTLSMSVPMQKVRRWRQIDVDARGDVNLVLQRKDDTGRVDTVTVSRRWSPEDDFEYSVIGLTLYATDSVPIPSFRSADLRFTPLPQIIASSVAPVGDAGMTLRGDTMVVGATAYNARFDHGVIAAAIRLEIRDTAGANLGTYVDTLRVDPNSSATARLRIPTDGLPRTSILEMVIDPDAPVPLRYRVLYRALGVGRVVEDTIPPRIELYADGAIRRDRDAVGDRPLMEVLLVDQSKLPIENPDNMIVFVNGTRIRPDNVDDWQFIGTRQLAALKPDQPQARALLRFRFPMETGENLVIVRSKDASGNPDTTEISLMRPNVSEIRSVEVFPNPARSGVASIVAEIAVVEPSAQLKISVFDVQGRRTELGLEVVSTGRIVIPLGVGGTLLPNGFYSMVLELADLDGKTLSTATKKLVVTP